LTASAIHERACPLPGMNLVLRLKWFSPRPVEEVLTILQKPRSFPCPLMSPAVMGMLVNGDEAVPLLKPGRLLASTSVGPAPPSQMEVCPTGFGSAGLPAKKFFRSSIGARTGWRSNRTRQGAIPGRAFCIYQLRYPLLDIGRIVANYLSGIFGTLPPRGTRRFE
jgi:hypothetical protein